MLVQNY